MEVVKKISWCIFRLWNVLSRRYSIASNLNYHSNGHVNAMSNGMIFPQGLSVKLYHNAGVWVQYFILGFHHIFHHCYHH